jgi:hypothetical protein
MRSEARGEEAISRLMPSTIQRRGGEKRLSALIEIFRYKGASEQSSSKSDRNASIVAHGSQRASSSRRKGRPEAERPSSSARSRRRAR